MKILVVHGPNLDMLGERERAVYGELTLNDINECLRRRAAERGIELEIFQSNHEGELVEKLHQAKAAADAVVMNPAAFTHYSIALRDAAAALDIPLVEVHLSNIYNREEWRAESVIAPVAAGQISGFGLNSYLLGIEAAAALVEGKAD